MIGAAESDCRDCGLCAARSQVVLPTACPPGGLLAIGEAPGADEDAAGEGFVGAAGRRLDALLVAHGLRRGRDYGVANICRCRPPDNRKPTAEEIAACLPKLARSIEAFQPRVLLMVGTVPSAAFLGKGALGDLIAQATDGDYDAKRSHPALRSLGGRNLRVVPMPHTSGLAWNRSSPAGERWSVVGARQVATAVALLRAGA